MKKKISTYLLKIDTLLGRDDPDIDWNSEITDHLRHITFYMHERLIHLIVTALFAVLTFMVLLALLRDFSWELGALILSLLVLLVPYILHYYFLENSVQKMYEQYEKMLKKI